MKSYLLITLALVGCSNPGNIRGSARLPDCSDPPVTNLSGTWFDQGTVTITSDGCSDLGLENGSMSMVCTLNWVMSQSDNDVDIVVDEEYDVKGQFCDDTLHLEGGWWLPLADEGFCNYDDDDGAEVGIESGGSSLTYGAEETGEELRGTLKVKGPCSGDYDVVFRKL